MGTKHDRCTVRLNDRQARVLLAITGWERFRAVPPTISDLQRITGMSRGAVHNALKRLRDEGLVSWERGRKRTLHALVEVVA